MNSTLTDLCNATLGARSTLALTRAIFTAVEEVVNSGSIYTDLSNTDTIIVTNGRLTITQPTRALQPGDITAALRDAAKILLPFVAEKGGAYAYIYHVLTHTIAGAYATPSEVLEELPCAITSCATLSLREYYKTCDRETINTHLRNSLEYLFENGMTVQHITEESIIISSQESYIGFGNPIPTNNISDAEKTRLRGEMEALISTISI